MRSGGGDDAAAKTAAAASSSSGGAKAGEGALAQPRGGSARADNSDSKDNGRRVSSQAGSDKAASKSTDTASASPVSAATPPSAPTPASASHRPPPQNRRLPGVPLRRLWLSG